MANSQGNPVVILGSLNDTELKNTIDQLVKHVDNATQHMTKSFDATVEGMKKKLQELGSQKIEFGGSASSNSSTNGNTSTRRRKNLQQEQQQVQAVVTEYDKLAQVIQQKAAQQSRRYNVSSLQELRMQTHELQAELTKVRGQLSSLMSEAKMPQGNYDAYLQKLQTSLERITQLRRSALQDEHNVEKARALGEQYDKTKASLEKLIADRERFNSLSGKEGQLVQQYDEVRSKIRAIGAAMEKTEQTEQRQTQAVQNTLQGAKQYTEEIRKQAQAIRESEQMRKQGFAIDDKGNVYYADTKKLSIEEQVLNVQKEQARQAEMQRIEQEKEIARKQQEEAENQRILQSEQQITSEQQRRNSTQQAKPKTFADLGAEGVYSYQQLAAAMARVLQLDQSRIVIANEETDSIKRLNTSLRQMKETYNSLGANSRNSDAGKTLLGRIQDLEREINKLRSQASRPVDIQNVLGFKPQTLEDIAYKIRQLQSYKQGINITTPQGVQEVKNLNTEIDRLVKKQRELMGANQSLLGSNNALARSWNYMKNRLAFYMTMGATTQFVKNLIDIRGQYELNERALGILINSAERGTEIFNELSRMALVSPYTLIELSSAAKQLTAYDVAARDVVDTTRRLADMASAVGVPIDRLTYALGQIKAYGYLNARDARMFANAGIPLVKELADHYTELEGKLVSTADVYDRIKKKAVDYNTVMSVINQMTDEGGKFFDFQAKMADTLKVRIANLNLAWNNMLNDIGKEQQGVLTTGIKGLEKLFLHWRDINSVLNRAILTLGAVKTGQLLWLLAIKRTGKEVAVLNTVFGTKLATAIRTVGAAMKAAFTSPLTWIGLLVMAVGSLVLSIIEGNKATKEFNQSLREGAKSTYDDIVKFLEQYQSIRAQLGGEETRKGTGKDTTVSVAPKHDMDTTEATKAWEAIRNQIELSSQASDTFIGKLLSIKDVNERVREGFDYLESLAEVEAALKDVDDDTIKITKDWSEWWNLWQAPDGLVTNIKEFTESYKDLQETIENSKKISVGRDDQSYIQTTLQAFEAETKYNDAVANSASHTQKEIDGLKKSMDDLKDKAYDLQINGYISEDASKAVAAIHSAYAEANTDLTRFQNDLKTTTDSIDAFINSKGWQGDPTKVGQAYDQIIQKQINEWQLTPDQAYQYQLQVENSRSQAVKEATQIRLQDDQAALEIAKKNHDEAAQEQLEKSIATYQEQLNNWEMYNGRGRVIWNDYTKWLKEQHISELKEAYRSMTKNGTQAIDYSSKEWQDFVMKEAQQYAKEHKMSYDEAFNYLYSWVKDANKWSIFIPLTISTEEGEKSESDTLSDWDKKANDAYKKIQRLQRRIKELNNGKAEAYTGELTKANQELTQAQNELAEAERNGGHSSKEDAANKKANAKATRDAAKAQREAESELQKALGQELQLIDKVRQSYKTLTDAGMSHADAVNAATQGYSRSLQEINRVFKKYGMANLDLKKFVGTDNPHDIVSILEDQLKKLKGTGKAKPGEIQQLEVKIRELKIDAQKYDYKKITDGLNSELSKIKDEYSLGVEIETDPELGPMFADVFKIPTDDLPQTAGEYADKLLGAVNAAIAERNKKQEKQESPLTSLLDVDEKKIKEIFGDNDFSKAIIAAIKAARDAYQKQFTDTEKMLDDYVKKYGDYSDRIAEIERDRLNKLKKLNDTYSTEQQRESPEYKAKKTAINNGAQRQEQQVQFDAFKDSQYYVWMFENLDHVSTKAIENMRDKVKELIDTMHDLTPEQMKTLVSSYETLESKLITRNPFKELTKNLKKYRKTFKQYKKDVQDFNKKQDEVNQQEETVTNLKKQYELEKSNKGMNDETVIALAQALGLEEDKLKVLRQQLDAMKKQVDEENMIVKAIGESASKVITTIAGNLSSLSELRDNLKSTFGLQLPAELDAAVDGLSQVGNGISTIFSSITSLNFVGVASGVVSVVGGIGDAVASIFGDGAARTKKINKQIEKSQEAVRKLSMAYKDLERSVENSLGTAETHARRLSIANKEAQLAETERQLQLEKSKRKKDRDDDAIKQYEENIQDLKNEIADLKKEVADNLLGNDVKSAAEDFVDAWVEAWQTAGSTAKTTLAAIQEKTDDMVNNLIKKAVASAIVAKYLQPIYDAVDKYTKENSEGGEELTKNEIRKIAGMAASASTNINDALWQLYSQLEQMGVISKTASDADSDLSDLQQGIQSITEDTAGALEGYMNGVSQQVYAQTDILVAIRDAVIAISGDATLGVQAQILLQLQSSYQVQMSIQQTLDGWNNASGRAVRVEMVQ